MCADAIKVEFYFGDSNLPMDKYMWQLTGGPENKAIPLKEICKFKRMRRFNPYSAVVKALKQSKHLIVEGEEGAETVKRRKAYSLTTNEQRDEREKSTVYVKGFGDEV